MFLLAFAVAVLLCLDTLGAFFLYDDFAVLAISAPQAGQTWLGCVVPRIVGFWRPTLCLLARCLTIAFGLEPMPFHIACLVIHALVATATAAFCLYCRGMKPWLCVAAAMLVVAHGGAFCSMTQLCYACDSLLALGLVGGLICFDRWLATGARSARIGVWACFVFSMMAKETAMVYPVLLGLWMLATGRRDRSVLRLLAWLAAADALFAAFAVYNQVAWSVSYTSRGFFSRTTPWSLARCMADYLFSVYFPYIHMAPWPFGPIVMHPAAMTGVRFAVAAGVLGLVAAAIYRTALRPLCSFVLMAACCVLLPSLMRTMHGRFLYVAIPFGVLSVCEAARFARTPPAKWGAGVLIGAMFLAGALCLLVTPATRNYVKTAEDVRLFFRELKRASADWQGPAYVSVLDCPLPGVTGSERWGYLQHAMTIVASGKPVTALLEKVVPETTHGYRYRAGKLVPLSRDELKALEVPGGRTPYK